MKSSPQQQLPCSSSSEDDIMMKLVMDDDASTTTNAILAKTIKKKKKSSTTSPNNNTNENNNPIMYKNQPVVIDTEGQCSKNRTIIGGFNGHKYEIGKVISFQKSNVNGHPTIYSNRPIKVLGSIGVMIVNERSSRRVGQDRLNTYGVEIGTNKYAWVTESVIDDHENNDTSSTMIIGTNSSSSVDTTGDGSSSGIVNNDTSLSTVYSDDSTSHHHQTQTLDDESLVKKRKRDLCSSNQKSIHPSQKLDLTFLQPFPNFPPFGLTQSKINLPQPELKLQLLSISPSRAHSKQSTHFVINVSLNENDLLMKSSLITHLFSPFSLPISICFIQKDNPSTVYTITRKHILTPLQEGLKHDLEIFSYTPIIKDNNLECIVKIMYGHYEILTCDNDGLDFTFFGDESTINGEIMGQNASIQQEEVNHDDTFLDNLDELTSCVLDQTLPNDLDSLNLFDQFEMSSPMDEKLEAFKCMKDFNGHTLLHHFSVREMYNQVYELLQLGYDPLERDKMGFNALDWCKYYNLDDMHDILIQHCKESTFDSPTETPNSVEMNLPSDIENSSLLLSDYLESLLHTDFKLEDLNAFMVKLLKKVSNSFPHNLLLNPDTNMLISKQKFDSDILVDFTDLENNNNLELLPRLSLRYWAPEILIMMCTNASIPERNINSIISKQNSWMIGVLITELLHLSRKDKERNSIFGLVVSEHLLPLNQFKVLGNGEELRKLIETISNSSRQQQQTITSFTFSNMEGINEKEKERIMFEMSERSNIQSNNNNNDRSSSLFFNLDTCSESALDLISKIFIWDPTERITIDQIIEHPYWLENSETNKRNALRESVMKHKLHSQVECHTSLADISIIT